MLLYSYCTMNLKMDLLQVIIHLSSGKKKKKKAFVSGFHYATAKSGLVAEVRRGLIELCRLCFIRTFP